MGPREIGELLPPLQQPSLSLSPRLGGVHTANAAGRILNHKFMAPRARRPELSHGEVCVALLQRCTLFITRSPSLRSRSSLRSFPVSIVARAIVSSHTGIS